MRARLLSIVNDKATPVTSGEQILPENQDARTFKDILGQMERGERPVGENIKIGNISRGMAFKGRTNRKGQR